MPIRNVKRWKVEMTRRRLRSVFALVVLLAMARPVLADCGGPVVLPSRQTAAPGQTIQVDGRGWAPCGDDTNGCSAQVKGAGDSSVELELARSGETTSLGSFPVSNGEFTARFTVPTVNGGTYEIHAEGVPSGWSYEAGLVVRENT